MKAVFLDLDTISRNDVDLTALTDVVESLEIYGDSDASNVVERIDDAEIVISNKVKLNKQTLEQCKSLKLICVAATGVNNIDLQAASDRNVIVCNARGYATSSVVQHVFMLLLAIVKNNRKYQQAIVDGKWQQSKRFCLLDYEISDLTGKVLGIVGYGELGQAVASVARAFGMKVIVAERSFVPYNKIRSDRLAFNEVLKQSDVISLHCPYSDATRELISAKELSMMKSGAILINTARGGLVHEAALIESLQRGHLFGAAVDVLSEEPPREGNPLLDISLPNLIVTPHIAWASQLSRQNLINDIVANIDAFLKNSTRNQVDI